MDKASYESLSVIAVLLVAFIIARRIWLNISIFFARRAVIKNPSEDNAMEVYKLLKAKMGVSINNHPKDWAKYRDMFYHINQSCEIPSELKKRIKERLVKKGLYINNTKIIDNYKGTASDVKSKNLTNC